MQSPCEGFLPHSIDVCKTAHIFAQVRNARAEAMVKITNAGALKDRFFREKPTVLKSWGRLNKSSAARVKAKFQTGERREKIFFFLRACDARAFLFVRKTHADAFKKTIMGKAPLLCTLSAFLSSYLWRKQPQVTRKGLLWTLIVWIALGLVEHESRPVFLFFVSFLNGMLVIPASLLRQKET